MKCKPSARMSRYAELRTFLLWHNSQNRATHGENMSRGSKGTSNSLQEALPIHRECNATLADKVLTQRVEGGM